MSKSATLFRALGFSLDRLFYFVMTNVLPLLVLLRRQDSFDLRIRLLMNGAQLHRFLAARQIGIVLDRLKLWPFLFKDRQQLSLLLGAKIQRLGKLLKLLGGCLSKQFVREREKNEAAE